MVVEGVTVDVVPFVVCAVVRTELEVEDHVLVEDEGQVDADVEVQVVVAVVVELPPEPDQIVDVEEGQVEVEVEGQVEIDVELQVVVDWACVKPITAAIQTSSIKLKILPGILILVISLFWSIYSLVWASF